MSPVKPVADSQQIRLTHQKFYVVMFQPKVSTLSAHARYKLQAYNFAPINHQERESLIQSLLLSCSNLTDGT